ncbi:ATP-grasp domain-containing protein [Neisseria iguanae]|uniref:Glutathione synthetase n=1 Tax=Neisseria iguanae TaxID=90242 RepID=A0A2P7U256_9NEIS|nr:glutathione synthetase [Neisseria iguanae]PSJ81003.1 glutathione synthetase [Neisseria iguanae]
MLTLTTCRRYTEPPPDLIPLAHALRQRGIATQFAPWQNEPRTPFVLPLCAWDYADQPAAFAAWTHAVLGNGQHFLNPPELMRWNMNKRYLTDLAAQGIHVIPTEFLPCDGRFSEAHNQALQQILSAKQWPEAVVKPAIGQSGKGVCKIRIGESLGAEWADMNVSDGLMVQPYVREIEQAGETSLVCFNGSFSHAVRRQPPQGEWRANSAYGVAILPANPPDFVVQAAETVLRTLPQMPLYARVDGTIIGDTFLLNELEVIEPALYLHTCDTATAQFADAVAAGIEDIRGRQ